MILLDVLWIPIRSRHDTNMGKEFIVDEVLDVAHPLLRWFCGSNATDVLQQLIPIQPTIHVICIQNSIYKMKDTVIAVTLGVADDEVSHLILICDAQHLKDGGKGDGRFNEGDVDSNAGWQSSSKGGDLHGEGTGASDLVFM